MGARGSLRLVLNFARHFRAFSLIIIGAACIAVSILVTVLIGTHVIEAARTNSIALAHILGNHVAHTAVSHGVRAGSQVQGVSDPGLVPLVEFLHAMAENRPAALAAHPAVTQLDREFKSMLRGTRVLRAKLYTRSGMILYASDPAEVGEQLSGGPTFRRALDGEIVSNVQLFGIGGQAEHNVPDIDFVETYIPVGPADGSGMIFEIYYDVTPEVSALKRLLAYVVIGVTVVFVLLFVALNRVVVPADQTLREQHADNLKLSRAVEQSSSMVVITNSEGVIEYVNPRLAQITGYAPAQLIGKTPAIFQSGQTKAELYQSLWRTIKAGRTWKGEILNRKRSGELYWESQTISPVRNERCDIVQFVAIKDDVTERKRSEERIAHLALFDSLTDLPNRAHFMNRLDQALATGQRSGQRFALLFVDLDEFKDVNDTLGHQAGDEVLRVVAQRLRDTARETDLVARLGGDEFAVLQTGLDEAQAALALADRLIASVGRPFFVEESEVFVGASIGIAVFPEDGRSADELLQHADLALYRSKNEGHNTVHFYEEEMDVKVLEAKLIARDLRRALEECEFEIHYQPVVEVDGGNFCSIEALLRWHHPRRGMVLPEEFIAIAESTRMIVPIGEWVIEQACDQLQRWRDQGLRVVPVAVNVSLAQFQHNDFIAVVRRALHQTGLAPELLHLEVTESVAMLDNNEVERALHELKSLGVSISLDDFGSGYSGLGHLRRLPIDRLKIDRAFLPEDLGDEQGLAVMDALVRLGRSLRKTVVADGVERQAQYEFLRELKCPEMQGFLFSMPVPAERMAALLLEDHNRRGAAEAG